MQLPKGASVGGGAQFMDSVFRNAANTASVPSYWLLSATAAYDVNQRLSLRVNGSNLSNEVYVDRVGGVRTDGGQPRGVDVGASRL